MNFLLIVIVVTIIVTITLVLVSYVIGLLITLMLGFEPFQATLLALISIIVGGKFVMDMFKFKIPNNVEYEEYEPDEDIGNIKSLTKNSVIKTTINPEKPCPCGSRRKYKNCCGLPK